MVKQFNITTALKNIQYDGLLNVYNVEYYIFNMIHFES